jgi:two-component system NtrC family sensor kinase
MSAHILIVADTGERAEHLAHTLLPEAGYSATLADNFAAPPDCDVVLVDVMRPRASPFASLKAQRRMGCRAAAILFAPRLTDEMAAEVFPLNVREFVLTPVDDDTLLEKLAEFAARIHHEQGQAEVTRSLEMTQAILARRLEEMSALSRIGRSITTLTDVDTILSYIVEAAVYLARADEGAIFLLDEERGELLLRAEQGLGKEQAEAISRPSHDSDAVAAFQSGQPVMRAGDAGYKVTTGHLVYALINVPLITGGQVIGVLGVYNREARPFEDADQATLSSLADYAAIALDKARFHEQVAARVDAALETSRTVSLHAETMHDPIEGIESLAETLLAGGFGPLSEKQSGAVTRIKLAASRLREIFSFIRQTITEFEDLHSQG